MWRQQIGEREAAPAGTPREEDDADDTGLIANPMLEP